MLINYSHSIKHLKRCLAFLCLPIFSLFAQVSFSAEPTEQPLGPSDCFDTPVVTYDGLAYESLPVHRAIAERLSVNKQNDKEMAKISCRSPKFSYQGERNGKTITLVSKYNQSRKVHAEAAYIHMENHFNHFRKHGFFKVFWPNGKTQALEFYCYGLPVGFHQYFDSNGVLTGVADYTKSDYQLERSQKGRHTVFVNGSNHGTIDANPIFREVYKLSGNKAKRVSFHSKPWYGESQDFRELGLQSTIQQWTQPGKQGPVEWNKYSAELNNVPFDYTPFWETYQRQKQSSPGLSPPASFNTEVLACPWIDKAMELATKDRRFALPPIQPVSEKERQEATPQKYLNCMARPNADCLLDFALKASLQESYRDEPLYRTAFVAVRLNQPQYAISALDKSINTGLDTTRPDPYFAEPLALKAEAALQKGDALLAEETVKRAFIHALGRGGYKKRNLEVAIKGGVKLARLGHIHQTRQLYEIAKAEQVGDAQQVLGAIGLTLVQKGRLDEAMAVVKELQSQQESTYPESRAGRNDDCAVNDLCGLALAGIAEGLAEKGERDTATNLLSSIKDKHQDYYEGYLVDEMRTRAARAYALFGDSDSAKIFLKPVKRDEARSWAIVASALCEGGNVSGGLEFLRVAQASADKNHARWENAIEMADIALAQSRCGMKEKGRESFQKARKMAWAVPFCSGDVCMDRSSHYVGEVDRRILEAGEINLASPSTINRNAENEVALAVQLARMRKLDEGKRKLQSVSENLNKIFYDRKSRQEVQSLIERSHAQILSLQGRSDEAKDVFKQAFYSAKAIHTFENRTKSLVTLAQAMATYGHCDMAIPVIKDARITNDYTMMFYRQRRLNSGRELTAQIAYLFARCGSLNEAKATALSLLSKQGEPAGRAYEAKLLADQIRIKIAEYLWENNEKEKSLKEFEGISPSKQKLDALFHIEALESKKNTPDYAVIKKYLLKQAEEYEPYFWTLTSDAERRFMLSAFAKIIRIRNNKSDNLFPILVSESARIETRHWKARALCELGYTAGVLGHTNGTSLFEQGLSLAKQESAGYFTHPSPAGACAYWLKQAGNTDRAKLVVDYPIESSRTLAIKKRGQGAWASAGDLLGFAISYQEAENGEIALDWYRQFHFD